MILDSARLRNFRSHKDTTVNFREGVTVLVGMNGTGKSSLFEAIRWALYGSYELRSTTDTVPFRGASDGEGVRVDVHFHLEGGERYHVQRTMSGAKAFRVGTERPLAEGHTGVSEWVEDTFGMDRKEFRQTYFAEQKALEFLQDKGPTDRARFFGHVMGFDRIKEAQDLERDDKRDVEKEVQMLEARLEETPEVDREEIRDHEERVQDLQDKLSFAEMALGSKKKKVTEAEEARDELEKERGRHRTLTEQEQKLSTKLATAQERLRASQEDVDEYAEASEALKGVRGRISELEEPAAQREKRIQELESEVSTLRGELRAQRQHRSHLRESESSIEEKGGEGECELCLREFGDAYGDAMAEARRRIQDTEERIKEIDGEVSDLEAKLKQIRSDDDQAKELERLQKRESALEGADENLKKAQKALDRHQKNVTSIKSDLKDVRQELDGLTYDEDEWDRRSEGVESARAAKQKAEMKVVETRSSLGSVQSDLEGLREDAERREKDESRLEEAKEEYRVLADVDRLLTDLSQTLNSRLRPQLSAVASGFLTSMTDGAFSRVELDDDYQVRLYDGEVEEPVPSGGEEDVAALAVRLATSQLIADRSGQSFSMVKLDEIFAHVDEERLPLVMQEIRKLTETGRFRQVFLIEHRKEAEEYADTVLRVELDPANGQSHVEEVYTREREELNGTPDIDSEPTEVAA